MDRRQFIRRNLLTSISIAFEQVGVTGAVSAAGAPFNAGSRQSGKAVARRPARKVSKLPPSHPVVKSPTKPQPVFPPAIPATAISNFKPSANAINARNYGYGSGTSARDAINQAIAAAGEGKDVIIPATGGQRLSGSIKMKSGVRVFCQDTITSSSLTIIDFTNVNDAAWIGGTIHGTDPKGSQDGMSLTNARRNKLIGFKLDNVGNKGVSLAGHSKEGTATTGNYIAPISIHNCASGTGAGISLFGDRVQKNTIVGGSYSGNRIGITINGSHYNVFEKCSANGNWQAGIAVDGIVTGGGDGGKHNWFIRCTANTNGSSDNTCGGIYLGNGSSNNRFDYPVTNGNSGCGVYITSAAGTVCQGNIFIAAQCANNLKDGLRFSTAPATQVYQPYILNNKGRGLTFYDADHSILQGGISKGNKGDGVIVMSGYCTVTGVTSTANSGFGIDVTSGGSSPVNNTIKNNNVAGNQQGGLQAPGGQAAVSNNSGN